MTRRHSERAVVIALGTAALALPATAHGTTGVETGLGFLVVVCASIVASLFGGGLVLAVTGRTGRPSGVRRAVPALLLALGGVSVALSVGGVPVGAGVGVITGVGVVALAPESGVTDCGACADAALGAVTLHRGFEGVVLATVYVADAALGVVAAGVLAVHAAAETAAVGSLYAATRRHALGAVCLLQVGFVVGVVAGWRLVDVVPPAVESVLLALVGGVLLAVGTRETYTRGVAPASETAP